GNSCSCLDFAKGGGVCKHLLFVALRVLKLDRDDHRVWQTSLVPSELAPLLARLDRDPAADASAASVAADASVLRGYLQVCGEGAAVARRPLPADCPICFEEMQAETPAAAAAGAREAQVEFCGTCGHNVHADCRGRWAAASPSGDACPLCRSPWGKAAAVDPAGGPINLAAYSSEHRGVSLAALYPETHRWIRRPWAAQMGSDCPASALRIRALSSSSIPDPPSPTLPAETRRRAAPRGVRAETRKGLRSGGVCPLPVQACRRG
ncbi:unnamed protein product, partial [Prorocentrum cordatum]